MKYTGFRPSVVLLSTAFAACESGAPIAPDTSTPGLQQIANRTGGPVAADVGWGFGRRHP
jgi:hypothetical protein